MSALEPSFSVPFSFPVVFTRDLWQPERPLFADLVSRLEPQRRHRLLVAVDQGLAAASPSLTADITAYVQAHAARLALVAPPVLIPGGESSKNDLTQTLRLLELINTHGIDRQSFIVAIGGGAALDTISFAAATGHRGIRVIRIPSTVLAQADSGVAVKNGVNMFGKKNFVGTFAPPFAVINDTRLLDTLSRRDRIAGVSEIIKVALLKDAALFAKVEPLAPLLSEGDVSALEDVIRPSLEWHMKHICSTGDPFELGSARPLDFGHWAAHKLESITANRIRHGEAVAIGMALDVRYAVLAGYLAPDIAARIINAIAECGLPTWDDAVVSRNANGELSLIEGLREFREHLGGELHITMLRDIQSPFEVTEMDLSLVTQAISDLAPVH
jgi:3-dehydroquinate synthase